MPHMMGCRGAGHAALRFTDVKLDPLYLLGEEGQGMEVAIHSLSVSRVHIAMSNLGMAQRMLEISLKRAQDRVTFGKPIAARQMIKAKIADMQKMVHVLRCAVYDFARDFDRDPHNPQITEKAAICKLFSIDTVKLVSDEMLEIFGGDGYFEDCPYGPVERLYRDCRAMCSRRARPACSASPSPARPKPAAAPSTTRSPSPSRAGKPLRRGRFPAHPLDARG